MHLQLFTLAALLILTPFLAAEPRPLQVVGHRGLIRHAPENTLAGFAATLGFDTFVLWPEGDELEQIERYAKEVVPALRAPPPS